MMIVIFISILLLGASTYFLVKNRTQPTFQSTLIVNALLFLFFVFFLLLHVRSEAIITAFPPLFYWLLILFGVATGIISIFQKHIPGQLSAIAILIFMAYIAMFSIGWIILIFVIIQLVFVFIQIKR